jgi:hypothetical protein
LARFAPSNANYIKTDLRLRGSAHAEAASVFLTEDFSDLAIRPIDDHLRATAARLKSAFARGDDYSGAPGLSRDDCALFFTPSKRPARLGFVHALIDGETGELDVLFSSGFSVAARQETQNGYQRNKKKSAAIEFLIRIIAVF